MNLTQLKKDMELQVAKVKVGVIKASVRGDYTHTNRLEFWKKKNGRVEIKWSSSIPVKSVDRVKCDEGHWHEVEKEEAWIWDYAELTREDIETLVEFLK